MNECRHFELLLNKVSKVTPQKRETAKGSVGKRLSKICAVFLLALCNQDLCITRGTGIVSLLIYLLLLLMYLLY